MGPSVDWERPAKPSQHTGGSGLDHVEGLQVFHRVVIAHHLRHPAKLEYHWRFPWLHDVYGLVQVQRLEPAMNRVFREINSLTQRSLWGTCNNVLESVDFSRLEVTTAVGFLMITRGIADKLPFRPEFARRVRLLLERTETPTRIETLLRGLKTA